MVLGKSRNSTKGKCALMKVKDIIDFMDPPVLEETNLRREEKRNGQMEIILTK